VKDALAHIVYWKAHTVRVLRGERRPPELRGLDVNGINHLVFTRWRRRRTSAIVAWHRAVHREVLHALAVVPAAAFSRRGRSVEWPADLDGHSTAHRRKDIEAALARTTDA
jgi:hypothetical protein